MALYLLPTPRNAHIERAPKTLAQLRFATEVVLAMPAPNPASILGKAERFTNWKTLQVENIKGAMRWM